jgi:hypothetical protein
MRPAARGTNRDTEPADTALPSEQVIAITLTAWTQLMERLDILERHVHGTNMFLGTTGPQDPVPSDE